MNFFMLGRIFGLASQIVNLIFKFVELFIWKIGGGEIFFISQVNDIIIMKFLLKEICA